MKVGMRGSLCLLVRTLKYGMCKAMNIWYLCMVEGLTVLNAQSLKTTSWAELRCSSRTCSKSWLFEKEDHLLTHQSDVMSALRRSDAGKVATILLCGHMTEAAHKQHRDKILGATTGHTHDPLLT